MFMKSYQLIFILFLIMGTLIAVSSNSWFVAWLGLEINLMSLIPLILSELNFKSTESAIKYFLAQALASILLIAASCMEGFLQNIQSIDNLNSIIFLSLTIKAGLAPFHFWFPQVMNHLSWFKCILILIWQKIAPFILMSCFMNKMFLYAIISTSAVVGALGGLNQINIKLLLTYSSIAHSAWMLMLTSMSMKFWASYFSAYSLIVLPIITLFYFKAMTSINEIYKSKMLNLEKNILTIMILSLGGLPPFLGFSIKLLSIMMSIKMFSSFLLLILISSSLISLFFYMKMFFNLMVSTSTEFKINSNSSINNFSNFLMFSIMGNLLMSLLVLLT